MLTTVLFVNDFVSTVNETLTPYFQQFRKYDCLIFLLVNVALTPC